MSQKFLENDKGHPFYGQYIYPNQEQIYIQKLLAKYAHESPNEELKKKIYDELQMERYYGRLKIPFKVILKKDVYRKYPDLIEVILDTKL